MFNGQQAGQGQIRAKRDFITAGNNYFASQNEIVAAAPVLSLRSSNRDVEKMNQWGDSNRRLRILQPVSHPIPLSFESRSARIDSLQAFDEEVAASLLRQRLNEVNYLNQQQQQFVSGDAISLYSSYQQESYRHIHQPSLRNKTFPTLNKTKNVNAAFTLPNEWPEEVRNQIEPILDATKFESLLGGTK